jgi:hypothetical protein
MTRSCEHGNENLGPERAGSYCLVMRLEASQEKNRFHGVIGS